MIFQLKNIETFRELLWDLKYCYDVASIALREYNGKTFEDTTLTTFIGSTFNEVEANNKDLYMRVIYK